VAQLLAHDLGAADHPVQRALVDQEGQLGARVLVQDGLPVDAGGDERVEPPTTAAATPAPS
jgi:hypothetical protein